MLLVLKDVHRMLILLLLLLLLLRHNFTSSHPHYQQAVRARLQRPGCRGCESQAVEVLDGNLLLLPSLRGLIIADPVTEVKQVDGNTHPLAVPPSSFPGWEVCFTQTSDFGVLVAGCGLVLAEQRPPRGLSLGGPGCGGQTVEIRSER